VTRILYLVETSDRGGTETVIVHLLRGLNRALFTPVLGAVRDGWLVQSARAAGAELVPLDPRGGYDGWNLAAVPRLATLIRRARAELVHCFLFHMNLYGAMAARLAGRPAIASLRSVHYDFATTYRRLAWRLVGRCAAAVTAVSEQSGELLSRYAHLPNDRISVISNGVDTCVFHPGPKRGILQQAGVPPDKFVIGSVGRLAPVKGHHYLIQAAAQVLTAHPDCHFVLVGEHSAEAQGEMQAQAARLGLLSHLHLLGPRDDISDILREFDIFVLPSLSEGMSNALLEAMSTGLAVVATAVGGNLTAVDHGRSGLLVSPGDPWALADAILRLIEDPALRLRLGNAARTLLCEHFSLPSMIERYQALYQAILQTRIGKDIRAPHGDAELSVAPRRLDS